MLISHAEMQVAIRMIPNYGGSHVIMASEPVTSAFQECSDALRGLWLIFKDAETEYYNKPRQLTLQLYIS